MLDQGFEAPGLLAVPLQGNLAQAHGRAFQMDDLNQALARAQSADGEMVAGFTALAIYGMKAVDRAKDSFSFLLATGIVLLLGAQSILNMAVATASVPPKGIALPFLSFGGSSLIAAAAAAGILTRIAATGRDPSPLFEEDAE